MSQVTPGWKFVAIVIDGDDVLLEGLNPWTQQWHSTGERAIQVAHPSYSNQRQPMWIYELRADGKSVKFAAGEFSNCVWGFYLPE